MEKILVLLAIILSVLVMGINLFKYPYYENDEGTYISQAWSLVNDGKLAPYTYNYDHAPGGWLLIALWSLLTGGFFSFGFSINSGRVLMLVLHLASCLLLFAITKRFTKNTYFSILSVLFFSLSPLGIYFQRRVLLDNIMVFWFLFSLYLLLINQKIFKLAASGLLLGIATITKEVAVFFIPAFLYTIYSSYPSQKFTKISIWAAMFSIPILAYILYALIRIEFFPYGSVFGGNSPHVSLIDTWSVQLSRPGSLEQLSSIILGWFRSDPILLSLGFWSLLANITLSGRNSSSRTISILTISYIIYLFRGGMVLDFYFIPLHSLFSLSIPVALFNIFTSFLPFPSKPSLEIGFLLSSTIVLLVGLLYFGNNFKKGHSIFISDQTTPQIEAVDWILSQDRPDAIYAIDNYAYVDLHAKNQNNFSRADYYWKIDLDPEITQQVLNNDWRNISYLTLTDQMIIDSNSGSLGLINSAINNSTPINKFSKDGWQVEIRQINR